MSTCRSPLKNVNLYIYIYIYFINIFNSIQSNKIYIRSAFNRLPEFFLYRHLKLSLSLENSVCYCYTSYEITDQFL